MKKDKLTISIVVVALALLVILPIAVYRSSLETVTIKVKKTERDNSSSDRYLVYAEDGKVYEIADSLCFLRYDSSNIYGELTEGKEYRCEVAGWRIPFFSAYPNIIGVYRD